MILRCRHHEQEVSAGMGAVSQDGDIRGVLQLATAHSKRLLQGQN